MTFTCIHARSILSYLRSETKVGEVDHGIRLAISGGDVD